MDQPKRRPRGNVSSYGSHVPPYDADQIMTIRDEVTGSVFTIRDYPNGRDVQLTRVWTTKRIILTACFAICSAATGALVPVIVGLLF